MPVNEVSAFDWVIAVGLGMLWLGLQIVWVAPVPRMFRAKPDTPPPAKGTPEAFGVFWLDQYAWIGLLLSAVGLLLTLWAYTL